MRLTFEHGTVVVSEPPDLDLGFAPGLMWDPRVELWRAPARFHSDLVRALRAKKLPLDDRVRPRPSPRMPEWTTPELRPYQKGALMAWALAERRGLVVLRSTNFLAASSATRYASMPTVTRVKRSLYRHMPKKRLSESSRGSAPSSSTLTARASANWTRTIGRLAPKR